MKLDNKLRCLITSQTRSKLLNLFFGNIAELYYVRQLVRLTGEEINSVRRELQNLKDANLITSEVRGNRLYYWSNPGHVFGYILELLAWQQTIPFVDLIENKAKIGSIKLILASQSYLHHQTGSGLDMIIIGEASLKIIEPIIAKHESKLQREINYMIMDKSEFHLRQIKRDPILVEFLLKLPAVIYGQPADII